MIIVGNMIKQIKEINGFNQIGKVFEITNIDDGIITFKCDFGIGVMSYNEFEKYFERYVDYSWTDWISEKFDIEPHVFFEYKTNNKKVIVRYDGFLGKAYCAPSDTFNLETGINIALSRAKLNKAMFELEAVLELYE